MPPSTTRDANSENFPVGSWLLAPDKRPVVASLYRLARLADDIADDPHMEAARKLALLDGAEAALMGRQSTIDHGVVDAASDYRQWIDALNLSASHPRQLLEAFRADSRNRPCRSWSDLLTYCRYSANPVGRFLLELHGESEDAAPASDALCTALQILNHLQDARDDMMRLNRVYVPLDWLAEVGLDASALTADEASPAMRAVLTRMVDGVDQLQRRAESLPSLLTSRRLRMEAAVIVDVSRRLARRLRHADTLRQRVVLGTKDRIAAFGTGIIRGLR